MLEDLCNNMDGMCIFIPLQVPLIEALLEKGANTKEDISISIKKIISM